MKRFLSLFLCFLICLSFLPAPEALVGRMIDVRIDGADEYDLIASMI